MNVGRGKSFWKKSLEGIKKMEHLSEEKINKYLNGKFVYQELLQISAHLINCRNNCLKRLKEIDPNFLEIADRLEAEREKMIKEGIHIPDDEIRLYVNKSYSLEKRLQMNAHFTRCPVCAEKLKELNPDYLVDFIDDKLARNKLKETVEVISEKSDFSFGFNFLVPASLLILLLLSIISLWIFSGSREMNQAKIETGMSENTFENREVTSKNTNNERNLNQNLSNLQTTSSNQGAPIKTPLKTQVKPSPAKIVPQENSTNRNPNIPNLRRNPLIVTNRSLDNNCESSPALAISPNNLVITDHQPILIWKKIEKAESYQIYLADTKNNLIEESKVGNTSNTYKIKTNLELNKNYEWKVVVTISNGKEIYGETATFSVGKKEKILSKTKPKGNETRCVTPKN